MSKISNYCSSAAPRLRGEVENFSTEASLNKLETFESKNKLWPFAIVLFAIALVFRLWGIDKLGNLYDEFFYYNAARGYAKNIIAGDFRSADWHYNLEHPPVGKYVYIPAAALNKVLKNAGHPVADDYHWPRVISALIGAATVVAVFYLAREFLSSGLSFLTALIYSFLPAILAYSEIICLDVTLMFLLALSLLFYFRYLKRWRPRDLFRTIIFISLAIATKLTALLFLPGFLAGLIVDQVVKRKKFLFFDSEAERSGGEVGSRLRSNNNNGIHWLIWISPFIVVAIFYLVWPWIWQDPIGNLQRTLSHWGGPVVDWFFGREGQMPWYYFLVHFIYSVPALFYIPFITAIVWGVWDRDRWRTILLILFISPFLISFYHLRQDGIRYVLPAYLPFAILVGIGIGDIFSLIQNSHPEFSDHHPELPDRHPELPDRHPEFISGSVNRFRNKFGMTNKKIIIFVIIVAYIVFNIFLVHPYYLDYYNELVGYPKTVGKYRIFPLGFYGQGMRQAVEYLNQNAPAGSKIYFNIAPDDIPFLSKKLARFNCYGADYAMVNLNAILESPKRCNLDKFSEVYSAKLLGEAFVWVYKK